MLWDKLWSEDGNRKNSQTLYIFMHYFGLEARKFLNKFYGKNICPIHDAREMQSMANIIASVTYASG